MVKHNSRGGKAGCYLKYLLHKGKRRLGSTTDEWGLTDDRDSNIEKKKGLDVAGGDGKSAGFQIMKVQAAPSMRSTETMEKKQDADPLRKKNPQGKS